MNFATEQPALVNIDDLTGLSLNVGRTALRQNKITDSGKRQQMQKFFTVFDAAIAEGLAREAAVARAKSAAGLPA